MYQDLLNQMKKQLGQMDKWFDAAVAHATEKKFDPNLYLGFRLAPDQFAFARQVQSACDTAKLASSRITGKEAPSHPDTEQTIDELRARVKSVIAYLDSFTDKDFEGVESRTVTTPRWEGRTMTTHDYFLQHAVPNFYFHATHAYAILRHNGVHVGKMDFLGTLTMKNP